MPCDARGGTSRSRAPWCPSAAGRRPTRCAGGSAGRERPRPRSATPRAAAVVARPRPLPTTGREAVSPSAAAPRAPKNSSRLVRWQPHIDATLRCRQARVGVVDTLPARLCIEPRTKGTHDGWFVRGSGGDRHRSGTRHRPRACAEPRQARRQGGRQRPRRQRRRQRWRHLAGAAGRQRDRRDGRRGDRQRRQRRRLGGRPAHDQHAPSRRSAICTRSSTTPASCATACWRT